MKYLLTFLFPPSTEFIKENAYLFLKKYNFLTVKVINYINSLNLLKQMGQLDIFLYTYAFLAFELLYHMIIYNKKP
ncbi:hypothetical protein CN946_21710 [Bacillus sp. AFS053548]|nr:hypothetical protein CN946_21710 [Bacillus sp. AFS053548]